MIEGVKECRGRGVVVFWGDTNISVGVLEHSLGSFQFLGSLPMRVSEVWLVEQLEFGRIDVCHLWDTS